MGAGVLWKAFAGSEHSRFVSLHAIAPYVVEELLLFKRSLESVRKADAPEVEKKEKSIWDRRNSETEGAAWVWQEVFIGGGVKWSVAQKRRVGIEAFVKTCESLRWDRDASRLCKLLSSSEDSESIGLKDIEWLYRFPKKSEEQTLRDREAYQRKLQMEGREEIEIAAERQNTLLNQQRGNAATSVLTEEDASVKD